MLESRDISGSAMLKIAIMSIPIYNFPFLVACVAQASFFSRIHLKKGASTALTGPSAATRVSAPHILKLTSTGILRYHKAEGISR
jgi:hypothetical protein